MRGDGMRPWRILRAILCWIVAVWLLAPLVVVVVISFSSAPFLQFPPPGFSMRWYGQLFSTPAWTNSLLVSVEIMIPAAAFATVLGTAASYALVRGRIPGANLIMACLMLPLIVPGMITAAALFGIYRGLGLNGTLTGLIIGHTVLCLPYVVATVSSALRVQDARLEQVASTLGANPVRAFLRVYLPLTLPGLMTGGTLVFVSTLGYYIIPALLGGPRQQMISQLIQDQIATYGNWGMAGSLSLLLLAATGALLLLLQLTVGLKEVVR